MVPLKLREQALGLLDFSSSTETEDFVVAETSSRIVVSVGGAPGCRKSECHIETGLGSLIPIASGLNQADAFAVVTQGAVEVACSAIDVSELAFGDSSVASDSTRPLTAPLAIPMDACRVKP